MLIACVMFDKSHIAIDQFVDFDIGDVKRGTGEFEDGTAPTGFSIWLMEQIAAKAMVTVK